MMSIHTGSFVRFALIALAGAVASCGGNNTGTSNAGAGALCKGANPPSECGASCNATSDPCSIGFYCGGDSKCTADCDVKNNSGCGGANVCAINGVCIDPNKDNGQNEMCASTRLSASRKTPNVILVIDRSGSMSNTFGTKQRWDVMKDFLIGEQAQRASGAGIVYDFQSTVRFGFVTFTGLAENMSHAKACPLLSPASIVQPALNAYSPILATYGNLDFPSDGNTPTGESIAAITSQLGAVDPAGDPTILLLATDGEPDTCQYPDADQGMPTQQAKQDAKDASIAAVTAARTDKGIQTFVVGVATSGEANTHFQALANAGATGGMGTFYLADNPDKLKEQFNTFINGQISCIAQLNGKVDAAQACQGTVKINDEATALGCNDTDGWKLLDARSIEIQGDACKRLKGAKANAKIDAVFPCGAVSVAF